MTLFYRYTTFLFILLTAGSLQAQTLKAFMNAAEEALVDKNYYNAMYYYSSAVEFDSTALDVRYMYGDASLNFDAYSIAETEFQFIVDNDAEKAHPLSVFKLAEAQQNLGKYEEAQRNYELFLSENSGEYPYYTARAEKEIEAVRWSKDKIESPAVGVTINRLEGPNTPHSEFGAFNKDGKLFYSSMQYAFEESDYYPSRTFSRILSTENDVAGEVVFDNFVTTKKDEQVPKSEHIAHNAFSLDGSKVYYTLCHYVNSYDIRCDLYVTDVDDSGSFKNGIKLPNQINGDSITSTQPALGYDVANDKEVLFFVSDRDGGVGGLDIWYSYVNEGSYSEPVNINSINTHRDDMTPFFHESTGVLYFSSDGYMGLGGQDVYMTYKSGDNYVTPENLLAPTNSSFNDVYYTLNEDGTEAHMSSNRTGSLYRDDGYEACCYDIYKLDIEEIFVDLNALIFNELTQEPLPGARIQIIDAITGEILFEDLNSLSHDYNFQLKCGREYLIVTQKDGYDADTTNLSLKDCTDLEEVTKKIYLKPQEVRLDVFTFDAETRKALDGAMVTLEPDGEEPIAITNRNGNDFSFDIIAGKKYQLVVVRNGYELYRGPVDSNNIIDGVVTENVYLELEKINLNEYLPVIVYFDNDHPDPRTRKLTTTKTYSETYFPYIAKKEEFKSEYSKSMRGDQKYNAENDVESFFEYEVKDGYSQLQLFVEKLKQKLDQGDKIELLLKGYASPRAANRYNLAIGQRRIWTLKNEIKAYSNQLLKPYIDSGRLVVSEVSFGEEIAPSGVSDSYSNRRLSVYSPEASRERKAEIVRVRVIN